MTDQYLAKIAFDARCTASGQQNYISTGLQFLEGELSHEFIETNASVKRGYTKNSYWAETDSCLLLALWADEGELQKTTETLYASLLHEIQARGYPHLVRMWNYFTDINRVDDNLERYHQFCIGRFNAFAAMGIVEQQFPSASALGHGGGDLLIYVLASKTPPQHFENPRQASAYNYPIQYGPRSPSFARASLLELADQTAKVFVSGTASVIGHVTQHPNDLHLQIQVTLDNLECLLVHIADKYAQDHGGILPSLTPEALKVYVRHVQDLPDIKRQITQAYPAAPIVYVAADICRADLLLEIDGVWNLNQ